MFSSLATTVKTMRALETIECDWKSTKRDHAR